MSVPDEKLAAAKVEYAAMMAAPKRMLLLASYCGPDRPYCKDAHPCADCLATCNTFMVPADAVDMNEYAGTLRGIVQGDRPLKKTLRRTPEDGGA